MRPLALLLALAFTFPHAARAQQKEPWLKAGDVVALVGGEDMVALAEEGWLETLVTWAQPGDRIRWRSLAWEGDTVFEQRRDLNYPTLEAQLDRMGATVVVCQFGKMESFAGKEGVAAFTEAYEKLLVRLSGEKKRRIALVLPTGFERPKRSASVSSVNANFLPDPAPHNMALALYFEAVCNLGERVKARLLDDVYRAEATHDGVHLTPIALYWVAAQVHAGLGGSMPQMNLDVEPSPKVGPSSREVALNAAIRAKHRLWFHYTRPQNWAFLAGNRTNQPSSRDHLDPARRWFPEEMEQWVPLIEAKEKEIWALAAPPR